MKSSQMQSTSSFKKENFVFSLNQVNKVKPKQLKKIDIAALIRSNRVAELNDLFRNLSQEDFEQNEAFDFESDEHKLIRQYQILMQYLLFSVNNLTRKHQALQDIATQQINYNKDVENVIKKQRKKLKEQDEIIEELTANCENMEYLVKQLHLEDKVKKLGLNIPNENLNEKQHQGNYDNDNNNNNNNVNNNNINNINKNDNDIYDDYDEY